MIDLADLLAAQQALEAKLLPIADYAAEFVLAAYGDLMEKVRKEAPSAVLVGGCVRDTVFGRQVKDLDIFVTSEGDADGVERALGISLHDVLGFDRSQGRAEYDGDANIFRVYESEDKGVNVMVVGSIVSRVRTFPDSISQVIFDGEQVLATQEFIDTARTGLITHSHEPMRPLKQERRDRIHAKYPDLKFKDIA